MISLDAATVLLQWAAGGMLFCWFTTRRRIASLGYGWLLRGVYACFAAGSFAAGMAFGVVPVREAASIGVIVTCLFALVVSVRRRAAGVSGARAEHDRRTARVAAMTGIERSGLAEDGNDAEDRTDGEGAPDGDGVRSASTAPSESASGASDSGPEFPPILDLVPAIIGAVGLIAAALDAGGNPATALARTLVGAAFIGAISDAMLLGHWYLTQPGLPRKLLNEMVTALLWLWPFEVIVMLIPPGMLGVLTGSIDDGWGGMLGWMWLACTITTIVLILVTRAALRERYYSAVMAATGLLYLAILTGFGMDIVARAVLAP